MNKMRPVHPGEVLREEYLDPLGMSSRSLAAALGVPANRVTSIVNESRSVSADTALRLARYFGTSAEFWLNLQMMFDLRSAEIASGAEIKRTVKPRRKSGGPIPAAAD